MYRHFIRSKDFDLSTLIISACLLALLWLLFHKVGPFLTHRSAFLILASLSKIPPFLIFEEWTSKVPPDRPHYVTVLSPIVQNASRYLRSESGSFTGISLTPSSQTKP